MTNIFLDGFSAFQNHFWIILCILLVVIWCWLVTHVLLVKFFGEKFTNAEYFSLSSTGWIFPLFIWAGLFFCINFLFGKLTAIIFSAIIFFISFFFFKSKKVSLSTLSLILVFLISLILRLAFLEKSTLPSYFDSAEHYRIIKTFVSFYQSNPLSIDSLLLNYYHTGYHLIASSIIYLFDLHITNAMLVFGQVVLAMLPLSFFFILKQETVSDVVAIFSCVIAGFAFHIPAHLVNWGKYPALLSLVGFQFVICLGYVLARHDLTQNQKSKLYWLIGLSILITTLIHTRTLIAFVLLVISFFITLQVKKISPRFQYSSFIFLFIVLGIELFYVHQSPVLSPLITGYTQRDLWSLVLVFILIPFSIKSFPNSTFFLLASLCLFIFLLFFPISISNYGTQTLLDRPFIQMLGYIPLSVIIGLGFAGLLKVLPEFKPLTYAISFILFAFLIFNVKVNYSFYPSDCCQLASEDDVSAIAWIDKNLSPDEKFLIASSPLYVNAHESSYAQVAADAGIWIPPLTSRSILFAPTNTNFELQQTLSDLCNQQINYIYIGSMPQSFNQVHLASHPNWYYPIFLLPNAQIYEIIGCN